MGKCAVKLLTHTSNTSIYPSIGGSIRRKTLMNLYKLCYYYLINITRWQLTQHFHSAAHYDESRDHLKYLGWCEQD